MGALAETREGSPRRRLFVSFHAGDAAPLAARLSADLRLEHDVCCEPERATDRSRAQIAASDAVMAILTPRATQPSASGEQERLCLEEIYFARFGDPPRPILPVLALACEVPLMIARVHYVDFCGWEGSAEIYVGGLDQLRRGLSRVAFGAGDA